MSQVMIQMPGYYCSSWLFIVSTVVATMEMHCYGHMAHGASPLHTLVRSLHDFRLCKSHRDLHLGIQPTLSCKLSKCLSQSYHWICDN